MSEVQQKCIEVANLLTNNIRPRLEPKFHSVLDELEKEKSLGLTNVLQLIETLDNPDEYVLVNCQELYYKLRELADAIVFSDIGEMSSIQNSLYNKIHEICDILNPDSNNQKEIHVHKLTGFSLSNFLATKEEDKDGQDLLSSDPVYEKIAEVFNSSATGKFTKSELSDKIDKIIESFNVKSSVRCKIAFVNRLSEVNDAINLLAKNQNVFFSSYLKFQIDETYTLLKHDQFYPKNCLFVETKTVFLTFVHKCRASLNIKEKFLKKGKQHNVKMKICDWICEFLDRVVDFLSSLCEKTFNDNCFLITLVNVLILMSVLI